MASSSSSSINAVGVLLRNRSAPIDPLHGYPLMVSALRLAAGVEDGGEHYGLDPQELLDALYVLRARFGISAVSGTVSPVICRLLGRLFLLSVQQVQHGQANLLNHTDLVAWLPTIRDPVLLA